MYFKLNTSDSVLMSAASAVFPRTELNLKFLVGNSLFFSWFPASNRTRSRIVTDPGTYGLLRAADGKPTHRAARCKVYRSTVSARCSRDQHHEAHSVKEAFYRRAGYAIRPAGYGFVSKVRLPRPACRQTRQNETDRAAHVGSTQRVWFYVRHTRTQCVFGKRERERELTRKHIIKYHNARLIIVVEYVYVYV